MPASYPVGLAKVAADTSPRLIILSGDEPEMRKRVVNSFRNSDDNTYDIDGRSAWLSTDVFIQGMRTSRDTRFCVSNADQCREWDWLPRWFNQVKRTKLLLDFGRNSSVASRIEKVSNSRAIHIDCSAPNGEAARNKIIKLITSWYGESPTQVNLLLNKHNWKISPCLQLLDKLALLNLSLTSDTIMMIGIAHNPADEFIEALAADNTALAMTIISRIPVDEYVSTVTRLSAWLDKLVRVKCSQAYMKSFNEIAFEVDIPTKETEQLAKASRRFEISRINKIALTLAAADQDLSSGHRQGVLEIVVSKW